MNNGPKRSENNKEVIVAKIDLKDRYSNNLRGPKASAKKSKIIRKKLDKFDPIKSSGTFKKFKKVFKNKKLNLTRLEDGIIKTISSY